MEITQGAKTALLFGATGMVGTQCLKQLLASKLYRQVFVFGRRTTGISHEKLVEHVVDFDHLDQYGHLIRGDDLFCCLGTTLKKAGSKAAFEKVDYKYIVHIARIASVNKVHQFLLISSVGADEDSLFFYNEIKGKTERAVKSLDFWATHILQPSILLGHREEFRLMESIAMVLSRSIDQLIGGYLGKYRPVSDRDVAKALIQAAQKIDPGLHIYTSDKLLELADDKRVKKLEA